jgi:hypothetical protein
MAGPCFVDRKRGLFEHGPVDIETQPGGLRRRDEAVNDGQLVQLSEALDVLGLSQPWRRERPERPNSSRRPIRARKFPSAP